MPDRTATRLTFNKAWVGRNIYITFEYNGVTYRYPHDEMLEITMNDGIIKGTQNWEGQGAYTITHLSEKRLADLEPYRETNMKADGKFCILKPILWNQLGYQQPDGLKRVTLPPATGEDKRSYPEKHGYGHEEWNGNPDFQWNGMRLFHSETSARLNQFAEQGNLAVLFISSHQGRYYAMGAATNVMYNTSLEREKIAEANRNVKSFDSAWAAESVKEAFQHDKRTFRKHWNKERSWIQWRSPQDQYHWFEQPLELNPETVMGKKRFAMHYSKYTIVSPDILIDILSEHLPSEKSDMLDWLSAGDFQDPDMLKARKKRSVSQKRGERKRKKYRQGANAPTTKDFSYWVRGKREVEPLHHQLQTAFVDQLKGEEITENSEYVDVRYTRNGMEVFAEIKPTKKMDTKYAIRAGVAQLLEYRFHQNPDARLELVLGSEPRQNEKAFVKHLGIVLSFFDSSSGSFATLFFDQ